MTESNSKSAHPGRWMLVFPAIVVLALVVNGLDPAADSSRLYFLNERRTGLAAEKRTLALSGSVEERSREVLNELMLGPAAHTLQPLFEQDARVTAVLRRGGKLHVELDVPDLSEIDVSFPLIEKAIRKTLSNSVPGAGSLELYVNGELAKR